jgi:hypothetical protein
VDLMMRLRCPYVLHFIGASVVPYKACLVTELCSNGTNSALACSMEQPRSRFFCLVITGSVADVVLSDRPFNYLVMLKFALDMAKALSFLHTYAPYTLTRSTSGL